MKVSLSFDFEEFDLPREHGVTISTDEAVRISADGAHRLLDLLARHGVRATAFCTRTFAVRSPETVRRLVAGGHEVAAHGLEHSDPGDPRQCREELERICGCPVTGYRSPRMEAVDGAALAAAGFRYDASLHPTFLPGRYCHLASPRTPFVREGLCEVPASVTPLLRLPLFWLSLHLLPEWLYHALARRTLAYDGTLVLYFHPWEFSSELQRRAVGLKVPRYVRANLGRPMLDRLERLILDLRRRGAEFCPIVELTSECRGFEPRFGSSIDSKF